jgi:prevent-host-death family protein
MAKVPDRVPIGDLRRDAAAVLQRARSKDAPILITQRGRATAVLVPLEEYERNTYDHQLLLMLARGEKEIASGRGHDLDSVLAETDELLAGRHRKRTPVSLREPEPTWSL